MFQCIGSLWSWPHPTFLYRSPGIGRAQVVLGSGRFQAQRISSAHAFCYRRIPCLTTRPGGYAIGLDALATWPHWTETSWFVRLRLSFISSFAIWSSPLNVRQKHGTNGCSGIHIASEFVKSRQRTLGLEAGRSGLRTAQQLQKMTYTA